MGTLSNYRGILAFFIIIVFSLLLKAGTFDKIALAIESGNAKEISRFFGKEIELTINEEQDVYSKTKAEIQLKNFFTQNSPKQFKIIHKGSSADGAKYAIGNLKTESGSFRTYMLVKIGENKNFLKELRFKKE